MSSIQEIKAMNDQDKPFKKMCEIMNSLLSSDKLSQCLKYSALKLITKDYNEMKGKPILSTMSAAVTMRNEVKMLWIENKGKFQVDLLKIIENHPDLTPISMITRDKWSLYYDVRGTGFGLENADEIGTQLTQELNEIESLGGSFSQNEASNNNNDKMLETIQEMMKAQTSILTEIKSVKTEMTNCATKNDMSKLATITQVEIKIKESESRMKLETAEILESGGLQGISKDEALVMITAAIEAKFNQVSVDKKLTADEIYAASIRDMLDMKRYRTAVFHNKQEGRLQLVLKNTDEIVTYRIRDTRAVRGGFEIDFGLVEKLIGAKFEVLPTNKLSQSSAGNLIVQIKIIHPFKKMVSFIHQLIRNNYECKNAFLKIRTPEAYDITKLLTKWKTQQVIVDFENKSYGHLQILVNDGEAAAVGTKEYLKTCSILYVHNPERLITISSVSREMLRTLADNKHFNVGNEIYKRPEELQSQFEKNFVIRVSKHQMPDLK